MEIENYEIFKVLSDKNRYDILNIIKKEKSICACKLLNHFNITQATLAYHMKLLNDCNLVNCYKDGTWCIYEVNNNTIKKLESFFNNLGNITNE